MDRYQESNSPTDYQRNHHKKSRRHRSRSRSQRRHKHSERRDYDRRDRGIRDYERSERGMRDYDRSERDTRDDYRYNSERNYRDYNRTDKFDNRERNSHSRSERFDNNNGTPENETKEERRARRKATRWGGTVGPAQAVIPSSLNFEDAKIYSLQLALNEVNNKLTQKNYSAEYEIMNRLPEPDPQYSQDGKRINTKEYRAREMLENRKRDIMVELHELRPDLVPNIDRVVGHRIVEKVFIPNEDHPDINFPGLIIGPRGMTQKELEKETETKIILRGKGSVKVCKLTGTNQSLPGDDEPLHAYITATSRERVQMAAERIRKIIDDAIEHPELENELRKNQMKQLAIINGTYRETDGLNILRMREEAQSIVTNTMVCATCGGVGHTPRDCKLGNSMNFDPTKADFNDPEYKAFLASMGKDVQSYTVEQPTEETKSDGVSSFIKRFVLGN